MLSLFIIAFYSCSNENVSSQKLQKMVETTEDGLSETTFLRTMETK
jgi:hypothetical protein